MSPTLRPFTLLLLLGVATAVAATQAETDPADEARESLRAAELAFARSVAEQDREAFAGFVADDAVFLGAEALEGKAAILAAWAPFFAEGGPTLEWEPATVVVRAEGSSGLTRGPYRLRATGPDGAERVQTGTFMSIWSRGADGRWRVVFDSGCPDAPE